MRPLSLTMQAFSAYGGRQELDFGALGPHRLFLISGPTGAGKTTVLDGICYALFGESSGAERGAAHLRSHHAPPDKPTEVTFDFAIGRDRWRIWRKPAWQRPKLRGSGMVTEPAEQALWPVTPEGGLGSPIEKEAELRERVAGLLGYRADEFRQVVLLPQGRFRELLSANPRDRQDILRTLFRTVLYQRIEEQLQAAARAAEEACKRFAERRRTLLAQAGVTDLGAAEAVRASLAGRLAAAEAAREAAVSEARRARAAAEAGRRDAERLAALARAEDRLRGLEAEAEAVAADRSRLEAARRADRLSGERQAARLAREAYDKAMAQAQEDAAAAEAARAALAAAEAALADADAREAEARRAMEEATRLRGLLASAERLAEAEAALAAARAAAARAEAGSKAAAAAAERALAGAEAAARAVAEREAVALQAERHRLSAEAAAARLADARALARSLEEATAQRAVLAAAQAALAAAEAAHAEARDARTEAARRLAADHAAALAAGLRPGEPCPVCGNTHHPAPAMPQSEGPLPDLAALDAAEARAAQALEQARGGVQQAGTALRLAEQQAASLRDRLGTEADTPAAQFEARLREARDALAAAEAAAQALAGLRRAQAEAAQRQATAAQEAAAAAEAAQGALAALSATEATAAERRAALPPDCADPAGLQRAAARATATAERLQAALRDQREARIRAEAAAEAAAATARRSAAEAEARAKERAARRAALEEKVAAAGFPDLRAFHEAALPPEVQEALTARVEQHEADRAAAAEAVAAARRESAGIPAPDLPALEAAQAAAEQAATAAADAATTARNALEAQERLLVDITAAERALEAAQADHGIRRDLADLAAGKNPKKLSLEGFVLRSLFEEALAAANRRLRGMLQGRYLIRRREEPLSQRQAVGLDIEVLDQWNDQARPAGTLSGGEGFCASLALALGLADTVQAHAGAKRIDSLFIDEGFGTLDPEALETAMEVLSGLHGQDRLIGVISHVPELRNWIEAKLVVTPGRRGSTAAFRIG